MRFDGSRFLPWASPDGKRLPSNWITSLLGARDGSLWIGTLAGLAHFVERKLSPASPFWRRGIFLSSRTLQGKSGLRVMAYRDRPHCVKLQALLIHCLDKADGVSVTGLSATLIRDITGNLWAGTDRGIFRWKSNSFAELSFAGTSRTRRGMTDVTALAQGPDRSLWVGMTWTGKGRGLQQFKDGIWKPLIEPGCG